MSPVTLGSTAYSDAAICMQRYKLHQIDHLVRKPADISPKLRRGVWIHRALEAESKGLDWSEALLDCEEWAVERGVDPDRAREIRSDCYRILAGYFEYWDQSSRWDWKVVATEETIEHTLGAGITIKPTIDKVVEWRNQLWLVEHKSTAEIPDATWRAIDPQTALQFAACVLSKKYDVVGIIFDYLVTREPSIPRVKKDGRFYAGTEKQTTTSAAFVAAAQDVFKNWDHTQDGDCGGNACLTLRTYVQTMDDQVVNDGHFYQRFEVYRPVAAIAETLKDLRATAGMIELSERLGHWRRLNNLLYCQRFCPYEKVCAAEYILGRRSSLRETEYMIEDPNDREGRDQQGGIA